jgi:hypothetical protein
MHNAALRRISCPLCRNNTDIERPNNLNSDVELLRLIAERRTLQERAAMQDDEIARQHLQIVDLQQQVAICQEMHGGGTGDGFNLTTPLESPAPRNKTRISEPSTSGHHKRTLLFLSKNLFFSIRFRFYFIYQEAGLPHSLRHCQTAILKGKKEKKRKISFIVTAVRQLRKAKAKAKAVKAANHLRITVGKVKVCAV